MDDEETVAGQLREAGFDVSTISELRESGTRYRAAIPILLEALSAARDRRVVNELVRALSVPWAKPDAVPVLLRKFHEFDDGRELGTRWAIGNALEVTWTDEHFEELASLAEAQTFGRSREMIVLGLAKSKDPRAAGVLVGLLDDSDVNGHAVSALTKVKTPAAREGLQRMLQDERAWVRKDAAKALAALDT